LATVTGKTTAQASRGLSVGTSGSASIGSVFFTGGNIYNAAFDCAQATFASSSVAALRMAPNQFIDLTGDYATGALNAHALGYSTSSTSLEYRISGTAVFLVKDSGEISAAASASDPAFNVFGSGVVGFDTANATLTNAIRMGADQAIAWESTGTILTRYDSTAFAWQFLNGSTVEFQIGTGGAVNALASYAVAGTKVVGPQITGYGTPTGASKISNFPGASATLVQCSEMIAQIVTDLKTHGLLAA
ncbi:MAG: hypothetical protein KGL63_09480, partial [Betaproteobacteria bacterium]|nr:hypothetical protein [Betaproteobacteria bacterium]